MALTVSVEFACNRGAHNDDRGGVSGAICEEVWLARAAPRAATPACRMVPPSPGSSGGGSGDSGGSGDLRMSPPHHSGAPEIPRGSRMAAVGGRTRLRTDGSCGNSGMSCAAAAVVSVEGCISPGWRVRVRR